MCERTFSLPFSGQRKGRSWVENLSPSRLPSRGTESRKPYNRFREEVGDHEISHVTAICHRRSHFLQIDDEEAHAWYRSSSSYSSSPEAYCLDSTCVQNHDVLEVCPARVKWGAMACCGFKPFQFQYEDIELIQIFAGQRCRFHEMWPAVRSRGDTSDGRSLHRDVEREKIAQMYTVLDLGNTFSSSRPYGDPLQSTASCSTAREECPSSSASRGVHRNVKMSCRTRRGKRVYSKPKQNNSTHAIA